MYRPECAFIPIVDSSHQYVEYIFLLFNPIHVGIAARILYGKLLFLLIRYAVLRSNVFIGR